MRRSRARRLPGLVIAVCVLSLGLAGCATERWDVGASARSILRHAAQRTLGHGSASFTGTKRVGGSAIVRFSGAVDFTNDHADVVTDAAGSDLPPFDERWVNGWSYLQMPRGQLRPPTIPRTVNWLAFHSRRYEGAIPVPGPTLAPGLPRQMVADVAAGHYSAVRVPYPDKTYAAYRVSHLESAATSVIVLVRAREVVGFDSTPGADETVTLSFADFGRSVHVEAPPTSETRIVPRDANLYQRPQKA